MRRSKVTVIGAGNVGATTAQRLAERDYADVVLLDVEEDLARGKALDLNQAGPLCGYEPRVVGTSDWAQATGSDLVVVTAGSPRRPGMSRDDLLRTNAGIVSAVCEQIAARCPDAVVVVVTNPLDAMCHVACQVTRFPRGRIVGMAGILDSARFSTFLAWELGVSVRDVDALVLGGHGDAMVPAVSYATVAGVPVAQRIAADRIEEIVRRTRDGGAEVVELLGTGSAYYAPAAAVCEMADAILLDRKRVLPCSAQLLGEYGIEGVFCGVPVVLGREGIEDIVEIDLSEAERAALHASADGVRDLVAALGG